MIIAKWLTLSAFVYLPALMFWLEFVAWKANH